MTEIRLYRVSFKYGPPAYVTAQSEGEANILATQRRGRTPDQIRWIGYLVQPPPVPYINQMPGGK